MAGDERFFADLPSLERFVDVPDLSGYRPAPDSWYLVLTDVEGSTRAIDEGRYKEVNALGVASIVAVRNAAAEVDIPFVFGGDGATLICPGSSLPRIRPALRAVQRRATEVFDLAMRAGAVPVAELRRAGHDVLVARYRASRRASFAMLAGSGLTEGERWIKDPVRGPDYAIEDGPAAADFSGFECRWNPIPAKRGEVVSLLVRARSEDAGEAASTYRRVIAELERAIGGDGHPVAPPQLNLATESKAYDAETKLRSGRDGGIGFQLRRFGTGVVTGIGRFLLRHRWNALGFPGRHYREEVVANTDFRKFDDTLRMVIDVTHEQKALIEAYLEERHRAGEIVYGIHTTNSALMTCIVTQHEGDHVHFVDGNHGGYALAAKQLKSQMKAIESPRVALSPNG